MEEKINALKIELFDILEQQSFLNRRIEMLEAQKQEKIKALNELRETKQAQPEETKAPDNIV